MLIKWTKNQSMFMLPGFNTGFCVHFVLTALGRTIGNISLGPLGFGRFARWVTGRRWSLCNKQIFINDREDNVHKHTKIINSHASYTNIFPINDSKICTNKVFEAAQKDMEKLLLF